MYNFSLLSLCGTFFPSLDHIYSTLGGITDICEASVSENIFVLHYSSLAAFAHTYWQRKPNKTNKNYDDFGWVFHGFD